MLPSDVATILGRATRIGEPAQAFLFLTADAEGFPHVAMLSARELAVLADGTLHAAVAASTTRANLLRSRSATVVAVEGTTVHSVKLRVSRTLEVEELLGVVLDVASHKADSLGIPLTPISFVPTAELGRLERWDRTDRVLAQLAAGTR